jgi:hypothetical protein
MFRVRPSFSLIALFLLASFFARCAFATNLMDIINAYGGTSALAKTNSLYFESTVCETSDRIPESQRCYRSLIYLKDGSTGRLEEIRGAQRAIWLVHPDSAQYFVDGSWLTRFSAGPAGRDGMALPSAMLSQLHASLQSGVWSVLIKALSTNPTIRAGATRDGKPADVLSAVIEAAEHSYLFDPQTHLCIEHRFSVPGSGELSAVYTDYRSVSGLQSPFRIDVFRDADKQPSALETFQKIGLHQSFSEDLFEPPARLPLWFAPAIVAGVLFFFVIFILLLVAQRTRALKEESQPTASLLGSPRP